MSTVPHSRTDPLDALMWTRDRALDVMVRPERGKDVLRRLLEMLDTSGVGLDRHGQEAVVALLQTAWRFPGSTREAMRDALGVF